ncbi:recombinase family protein [bacterium]|nr:recombinase family protein [bacterium]
MFELASTGHTYGEIARWLNARGIKARNGNEWSISTLSQLLRNSFFLGEIHLKGEVFHAKHQCRIDTGIWEAAQHPVSSRKGGRPSDYVYLLPNVFTDHWVITVPKKRAGEPLPMVGKWCNGRGGKRYHYYYRADRLRANGGLQAEPADDLAATMRVSVSANALEEAVLRELIMRADGGGLVRDLREVVEAHTKNSAKELKEMQRQLSRLSGEQTQLDELLVRAFSTGQTEVIEAINRKSARMRERAGDIQRQLEELENQQSAFETTVSETEKRGRQAHLIEELWKHGMRKELKRLLALLVHSVLVRVDGVWLRLAPVCETIQEAPASGRLSQLPAHQERVIELLLGRVVC